MVTTISISCIYLLGVSVDTGRICLWFCMNLSLIEVILVLIWCIWLRWCDCYSYMVRFWQMQAILVGLDIYIHKPVVYPLRYTSCSLIQCAPHPPRPLPHTPAVPAPPCSCVPTYLPTHTHILYSLQPPNNYIDGRQWKEIKLMSMQTIVVTMTISM